MHSYFRFSASQNLRYHIIARQKQHTWRKVSHNHIIVFSATFTTKLNKTIQYTQYNQKSPYLNHKVINIHIVILYKTKNDIK